MRNLHTKTISDVFSQEQRKKSKTNGKPKRNKENTATSERSGIQGIERGREKKKGSLKDQAVSNGVFTPKSTQNVVIGLRPEKTLFEYEWAERTAPERKSASEEKTERKTRRKKKLGILANWQQEK